MIKPEKIKCNWIPKKDIREIADNERIKLWSSDKLPIDMEYIFENKLNIAISPEHWIERMDIDAFIGCDLKVIFVKYNYYMDSQNRWESRLRFSFAHELGHFVLHKYIYENIDIENPEDFFNLWVTIPEEEYKNFEYQANEFAGRFLVPKEKLILEFNNIINNSISKDKLRYFLDKYPDELLNSITPSLCKPFGVSENVIERRVKEEGLWPPIIK